MRSIEDRRTEWLREAKEIEDRDLRQLEFRCRAAARFLGRSEDDWEDMKDLLYAIGAGRLEAIATYVKTPEEAEAWRNYMMNR